MNRYDKMLEANEKESREKVAIAVNEINRMLGNNEIVSVVALVRNTGLSRGFFYSNERVRKALLKAKDLQGQKGVIQPQKVVFEKAMEKQMDLLVARNQRLMKENEELKEENEKMRQALNKRDLSFIKGLQM